MPNFQEIKISMIMYNSLRKKEYHLNKTKKEILKPNNLTTKINEKDSWSNLQEPDEAKVSCPDLKTRKILNNFP